MDYGQGYGQNAARQNEGAPPPIQQDGVTSLLGGIHKYASEIRNSAISIRGVLLGAFPSAEQAARTQSSQQPSLSDTLRIILNILVEVQSDLEKVHTHLNS